MTFCWSTNQSFPNVLWIVPNLINNIPNQFILFWIHLGTNI
ncbi:putative replication factor C complex protein [Candida albicans SC5314]|nr:hypothetical protein MG9_00025 [Candida albicans P37037]KHC82821.1 putative replication factor C complex protein [Candida albicans SC5314]